MAPRHSNFESANLAPLPHYKMASHAHMLLLNPTQPIQNVPTSIASRRVPSSSMTIDLNTVPSEESEELSITCRRVPSSTIAIDLNTLPGEQSEQPSIACRTLSSLTMAIDLNKVLREGSEEAIPDLNQQPADDEGDQFHRIKEPQVHPLKRQSHYPQKEQHGGVHTIDLNIPACEGQQEESHEVLAVQDNHQQDGDFNFDAPHVLDDFYLNLVAADHQNELQQVNNMIDDMNDYGVYADAMNIVFDEKELEDSDVEEDKHATANNSHKFTCLTDTQRQQIYEAVLERSNCGKLKKNTTNIVAQMFQVSKYQVRRVWRKVKQCRTQGIPVDVRSQRKNCGRKRKQIDLSDVLRVSLHQRRTIRSLAKAIGVKRSTLHRWFKSGYLRRLSSILKPLLREDNKKDRLRWCLSILDERKLPNEPKFREMYNIIHMDEKWFNTTSKYVTYYMHPGEDEPHRTVYNKNRIGKVMFLSAVGRPIFDDAGNCIFDGKLGLWPFVRKEQAKRRSHNRGRGAKVTKPIKVDRTTMRSYLIGKVLDTIVRRWPQELRGQTIYIQQDNAPSHVPVNDEEFKTAVAHTGLDIRLINQPANSPDLNVLDLGFFNSLQSLSYDRISRNLDDLFTNVKNEFENYDLDTLNRVFLTPQGSLIEVIKDGGGNRYKIPHIDKDRLEALGMLPKSLGCDWQLIEDVLASLQN